MDDGHAIITIPFRVSKRADFPIKFVIDTGFTDELCLPLEAVALLNLSFKHDIRVNLADNSRVILRPQSDYSLVRRGARGSCVCHRTATHRGTALLDGHELVIQFTEGGLVTVDEL